MSRKVSGDVAHEVLCAAWYSAFIYYIRHDGLLLVDKVCCPVRRAREIPAYWRDNV